MDVLLGVTNVRITHFQIYACITEGPYYVLHIYKFIYVILGVTCMYYQFMYVLLRVTIVRITHLQIYVCITDGH